MDAMAYANRTHEFALTEKWQANANLLMSRLPSIPARVLDFGCNTGCLAETARRWFDCHAVGLDTNSYSISLGRFLYPDVRFAWYRGGKLPFTDGSFDAVLLSHVLNHLPNPEEQLSEFRRVLAPGGCVGLVTPNWQHHRAMTPANLVTGYRSDPTIVRRYTKKSLLRLMHENGFERVEFTYTGEPAYSIPRECLRPNMVAVFTCKERDGDD